MCPFEDFLFSTLPIDRDAGGDAQNIDEFPYPSHETWKNHEFHRYVSENVVVNRDGTFSS